MTLDNRALRARVSMLQKAVSLEPSGERNTHIQAVTVSKGGVQAKVQWCSIWVEAAVTGTQRPRGQLLWCTQWISGIQWIAVGTQNEKDAPYGVVRRRRRQQ